MALLRSIYTQELWDAVNGRPAKGKSIRVFNNGVLEHVFGQSHWVMPGIWFLPIVAYGIHRFLASGRPVMVGAAVFVVGWLSFSLVEYILHRWLFHYQFEDTEDGRLKAFLVHGYHHQYPDDRLRLVAPPLMSWPVGVVLFALCALLLPAPLAWIAFAGVCCGYLAYDWLHYYSHHGRPKRGVGKWLAQYHMLHHHDGFEGRYGISSPLWDLVFGTYAPLNKRMPVRKHQPVA
jgi:sterol desaturase/sphingolipid hydroxylase (fatty acid hydroxylase superfamily)